MNGLLRLRIEIEGFEYTTWNQAFVVADGTGVITPGIRGALDDLSDAVIRSLCDQALSSHAKRPRSGA